jgi:hypothetical protein
LADGPSESEDTKVGDSDITGVRETSGGAGLGATLLNELGLLWSGGGTGCDCEGGFEIDTFLEGSAVGTFAGVKIGGWGAGGMGGGAWMLVANVFLTLEIRDETRA